MRSRWLTVIPFCVGVLVAVASCTDVGTAPIALYVARPSSGPAPLQVLFDASASYDPDGTIVAYEWDFGDGTQGTGSACFHTYTGWNRAYTSTLVVRDNSGRSGSVTHVVSVGPASQYEGYALTQLYYSETDDLDMAVRSEFGSSAQVADWDGVKAQFSGRASEFANGVGLIEYDENALLYRGGAAYWSGSRHYFVALHYGQLPQNYTFLVHDSIDNHVLDLGSWYGMRMRVLVKLN